MEYIACVIMNDNHKSIKDIEEEMLQVEAAKKDPESFSVLYNKYYNRIFIFVYRRTEDEQLTADITSHVFLIALSNLKKFQPRGVPFSAWLFRIALNGINEYFRKSKRERVVAMEEADLGQMLEDPHMDMNKVEDDKLLLKALSHLSGDEIQFIEMRFFEKRQFNEIADILEITENNAKTKMYRLLEKLKVIMLKLRK